MAALTVRHLGDVVVRAIRIRAAELGRSAEVENREFLRQVLTTSGQTSPRAAAAGVWPLFRRSTAGWGSAPAAEFLDKSRAGRAVALLCEAGV